MEGVPTSSMDRPPSPTSARPCICSAPTQASNSCTHPSRRASICCASLADTHNGRCRSQSDSDCPTPFSGATAAPSEGGGPSVMPTAPDADLRTCATARLRTEAHIGIVFEKASVKA